MPANLKQKTLFTSGYEGVGLEEFIGQLKKNNVQILIDIREKPLSRKKGFSKKSLTEALAMENIDYLHLKELGSPSSLRKKLREDKDYSYFFNEFSGYLSSKKESLLEALEAIQDSIGCLLCFEKNHEECHRKLVVEEMIQMNNDELLVKHL